MIASMTGFGSGKFKQNGIEATAEVRSFNNRFLEVSTRLPKVLYNYDQLIKDIVRKHASRGRVNVSITVRTDSGTYLGLKADLELARAYKRILSSVQKDLDLPGEVRIEHLISLPDLITMEGDEERTEGAWAVAERALEKALAEMGRMRKQEGRELRRDLEGRVAKLEGEVRQIERLSKGRTKQVTTRLQERVRTLTGQVEIDDRRVEQEVAFLADRMDVTEECVRFHSHNKLFLETLKSKESSGRRLNFLLQEMNREANTIGAKANDAEISHLVVSLKEEIEKLREQVQNIE